MSRPVFVPFTEQQWATGTNYPAGGSLWSGQVYKVAPPGGYFTPAPLPAEYLNYQFNIIGQGFAKAQTNDEALRAYSTRFDLLRYGMPSTGSQLAALRWDPYGLVWLAVFYISTSAKLYQTNNNGLSWIEYPATPSLASARGTISSSPAAVVVTDGTTCQVYNRTSGIWTPATSMPALVRRRSQVRYAPFLSRFVVIGGGPSEAGGYGLSSDNTGATWSTNTVTWDATATRHYIAVGATLAVVCPAGLAGSYYVVNAAGTWTTVAASTIPAPGGTLSGRTIRGLTHDSVTDTYYLLYDASGQGVLMTKTPLDPASWTVFAGAISTTIDVQDMGVQGGNLFVVAGNLGGNANLYVALLPLNTWNKLEFGSEVDAGSYLPHTFTASTTRFALANSVNMGFSNHQGI